MFTKEQIELAHSKVKSGEDFPKYVKEIISIGVKSHEVVLSDRTWIFRGFNGQEVQFTKGVENIIISKKASKESFKQILSNHQSGGTDYITFCIQAGESGIERWLSDFEKMTVTYIDLYGNTVDVEPIPVTE